jgi:hypothetical protein
MRTSFFVFMYLVALNVISQKRCYTYDAAGNRALRDLACDVACSNLVSNTNDAGPGSLRKAVQCATAG